MPNIEQQLRQPPAAHDWDAICRRFADRAAREQLIAVAVQTHDTPLGQLLIAATSLGVVRIGLPNEPQDEILTALAERISPRILTADMNVLAEVRRQLDEYFRHRRHRFAVPIDWQLLSSDFRKNVLHAAATIRYGHTSTYKQLADQIAHPRATRAVGTALAQNPVPIIIPCHRVLRTGGSLGHYRGGEVAKRQLIAHETR
jgi:methylated-DNA-[protein]-cysteine S-methyltransferase